MYQKVKKREHILPEWTSLLKTNTKDDLIGCCRRRKTINKMEHKLTRNNKIHFDEYQIMKTYSYLLSHSLILNSSAIINWFYIQRLLDTLPISQSTIKVPQRCSRADFMKRKICEVIEWISVHGESLNSPMNVSTEGPSLI